MSGLLKWAWRAGTWWTNLRGPWHGRETARRPSKFSGMTKQSAGRLLIHITNNPIKLVSFDSSHSALSTSLNFVCISLFHDMRFGAGSCLFRTILVTGLNRCKSSRCWLPLAHKRRADVSFFYSARTIKAAQSFLDLEESSWPLVDEN
jgi:hypothetical protein